MILFTLRCARGHDGHSIYGEASEDESRELADEGISFGRIPWIPPTDA